MYLAMARCEIKIGRPDLDYYAVKILIDLHKHLEIVPVIVVCRQNFNLMVADENLTPDSFNSFISSTTYLLV